VSDTRLQILPKKRLPTIHFLVIIFAIVLIFSFWFLDRNFENVSGQETLVQRTNQVIAEIQNILDSIRDAETGIRGYALTKNPEYLADYDRGMLTVWEHQKKFCDMTRDNPREVENCDKAKVLIELRLQPLRKLSRYYGMSKAERAQTFIDTRETMQNLVQQADQMRAEEERILLFRSEAAVKSRRYFSWSIVGCFGLTLIVLIASYRVVIRNELRSIEEAEDKKLESWFQQQAIQMSGIVASGRDLKIISEGILVQLAEMTHALAGNFYYKQGETLKLSASFASEESKLAENIPEELRNDQTLVAEAMKKQAVWVVQNVPSNSLKISSSLVEAPPVMLIFIPFYFQNVPLAVVEIALLKPLDEKLQNLLSKIRDPISVNLNAAVIKQQTQALLEETQQQAEELQAQQEELRTSNEELEQQARALEKQQELLNNQNENLKQSRQDLESKATELTRTSQYKSDFLAKMSHELRTPLNSLLILATLLIENKENNLTSQQKEFVNSIYSAGNDLLSLINDILDLSKIEARKLNIRIESFTLESVLNKLQQTFQSQAKSKKIELKVEVEPDAKGIQIQSDSLRIEQILRNLLSNAMKFTDKGSVKIKVRLEGQNSESLRVSVQDTGIGIPAEKKDLIFEAFEQVDSSVSRQFGGTGLGLTISRELATLLGGKIELVSQLGQGSEFSLVIPLKILETEATVAPLIAKPQIPTIMIEEKDPQSEHGALLALENVDVEKNTILIIEDDAGFRRSIAETARSLQFEPIEADSSEVALQILKNHIPKAILLDIKLPGMSGMGLLEAIKQMPSLRHIPVHMISALEYQQNALRLGALGYLSKPVTLDKIRSALGRIEGLLEKKVKRLLIIEDDARQRDAIKQLVAGKDLEVLTAEVGKKAIDIVNESIIDCIILDLTLPDMSGFQFLEKLSGLDISLPPIVIYTGQDLSRQEEQELRRYSESIIIKGARSPERLLDEVNLFLHRVESLLPQNQQQILSHVGMQDRSFENKTVLVVDDDLRNVFALTSALESKGLRVQIAKNGIEALEVLDKDPEINIVLMDLMMPKMDGYETIQKIRQQDRFKNLPIVALTAKAMKEDQEKCIAAGANDYLTKPLNLANLLSVMRVWLTPRNLFA
jgi:CheY-like chemotaxis protein/CHASE3 domain sensor protein